MSYEVARGLPSVGLCDEADAPFRSWIHGLTQCWSEQNPICCTCVGGTLLRIDISKTCGVL